VKEPAGGSVSVSSEGDVALLRIDDGKANAFSRRTIAAMHTALDASAEAGAVMVCGRPGMLSAGLELTEVRADAVTPSALRKEFMHLMLRLFTYEVPVVVACTGHAIAGGVASSSSRTGELGSTVHIGSGLARLTRVWRSQ
jgi:enoyl-CoA hydratase